MIEFLRKDDWMRSETLHISPRDMSKKAKKLRHEGYVPGILYGQREGSLPVILDRKALERLVQRMGETAFAEIEMGNTVKPVKIKELQRDPRTGEIIHVDFQVLQMDKKVRSYVPIKFEGSSLAGKRGIVLQHQLNKIEVEGFPNDIPAFVKVAVNNLKPGQSIHVHDLEIGEELTVLDNLNQVIVSAVQGTTLSPQDNEEGSGSEEEKETEGQEM